MPPLSKKQGNMTEADDSDKLHTDLLITDDGWLLGAAGVPATADSCAYDPVQRLLAIGTTDGRVKILGRDGVERTLFSGMDEPSATVKLQFFSNRGLLARVCSAGAMEAWSLYDPHAPYAFSLVATLQLPNDKISSMDCLPREPYIMLGCGSGNVRAASMVDQNGAPATSARPCTALVLSPLKITSDQLMGSGSVTSVLVQSLGPFLHRMLVLYSGGTLSVWDLRASCLLATVNPAQPDTMTAVAKAGKVTAACWVGGRHADFASGHRSGEIFLWGLPGVRSAELLLLAPLRVVADEAEPIRHLECIHAPWGAGLPPSLLVWGGQMEEQPDSLTLLAVPMSCASGGPLGIREDHFDGPPPSPNSQRNQDPMTATDTRKPVTKIPYFGKLKGYALVAKPSTISGVEDLSAVIQLLEGGQLVSHSPKDKQTTVFATPLQALPAITVAEVATLPVVRPIRARLHALSLAVLRKAAALMLQRHPDAAAAAGLDSGYRPMPPQDATCGSVYFAVWPRNTGRRDGSTTTLARSPPLPTPCKQQTNLSNPAPLVSNPAQPSTPVSHSSGVSSPETAESAHAVAVTGHTDGSAGPSFAWTPHMSDQHTRGGRIAHAHPLPCHRPRGQQRDASGSTLDPHSSRARLASGRSVALNRDLTGHKDGTAPLWARVPSPPPTWSANARQPALAEAPPLRACTAVALCWEQGLLLTGHAKGELRAYHFSAAAASTEVVFVSSPAHTNSHSIVQEAGFQLRLSSTLHRADICCIVVCPHSAVAAAGDRAGCVSLMDLTKPSLLWTQTPMAQPVLCLQLAVIAAPSLKTRSTGVFHDAPEGRPSNVLILGTAEGCLAILDLATGSHVGRRGELKPKNQSYPLCLEILDSEGTPAWLSDPSLHSQAGLGKGQTGATHAAMHDSYATASGGMLSPATTSPTEPLSPVSIGHSHPLGTTSNDEEELDSPGAHHHHHHAAPDLEHAGSDPLTAPGISLPNPVPSGQRTVLRYAPEDPDPEPEHEQEHHSGESAQAEGAEVGEAEEEDQESDGDEDMDMDAYLAAASKQVEKDGRSKHLSGFRDSITSTLRLGVGLVRKSKNSNVAGGREKPREGVLSDSGAETGAAKAAAAAQFACLQQRAADVGAAYTLEQGSKVWGTPVRQVPAAAPRWMSRQPARSLAPPPPPTTTRSSTSSQLSMGDLRVSQKAPLAPLHMPATPRQPTQKALSGSIAESLSSSTGSSTAHEESPPVVGEFILLCTDAYIRVYAVQNVLTGERKTKLRVDSPNPLVYARTFHVEGAAGLLTLASGPDGLLLQAYSLPSLVLLNEVILSKAAGWLWDVPVGHERKLGRLIATSRLGQMVLLGEGQEVLQLALTQGGHPPLPSNRLASTTGPWLWHHRQRSPPPQTHPRRSSAPPPFTAIATTATAPMIGRSATMPHQASAAVAASAGSGSAGGDSLRQSHTILPPAMAKLLGFGGVLSKVGLNIGKGVADGVTLLVQNVEKGVHQIGSRITDFAEGGDADVLSAYNRNQPPLAVIFAQEQQAPPSRPLFRTSLSLRRPQASTALPMPQATANEPGSSEDDRSDGGSEDSGPSRVLSGGAAASGVRPPHATSRWQSPAATPTPATALSMPASLSSRHTALASDAPRGATPARPTHARTASEIKRHYRPASAADATKKQKTSSWNGGERLRQLDEKAADLENSAAGFADMARQLAEAQRNRKWWQL
ncbi:MAG: hypothetical protein WDW38_002776 [Sanguina aurantia]